MDFYSFVNSRDIREHLKKINYQFTAIEAAWIVWKSKNASFSEKHQAWNEIINTYSDCEIEKRLNTKYQPSLHTFLRELMEFENYCVTSVKTDEPYTFFTYKYLNSLNDEWGDGYSPPATNFSTCFELALEICRTYCKNQDISDARVRVKKQWFDGSANAIEVEFTSAGDILKIMIMEHALKMYCQLYEF